MVRFLLVLGTLRWRDIGGKQMGILVTSLHAPRWWGALEKAARSAYCPKDVLIADPAAASRGQRTYQ